MDRKVYGLIENSREEFVETLKKWISVPSVKDKPEDGAPFGREVRNALDLAVKTGEEMGFATRNIDGYACDITYGDGEEEIAVLGHLDVVPAGDGWEQNPFEAVVKDGKIYGRGTSDDKGPSLAALFALKAIKDAGIKLKKSVKVILGCDEESGWEDMEYYSAHAKMPDTGFSPDASFPLINTEKGMIHMSFTAPEAKDGLKVIRMSTGERVNVIPGESSALLAGGEELAERIRRYAKETGQKYETKVTGEGVWVKATGIPGHSAYPEGKVNAIRLMLKLLKEMGAKGAPEIMADALGNDPYGIGLECDCADEISGRLTCNIGILKLEKGQWYGTLDFRCPVTADQEEIKESTRAHMPGFGFRLMEQKPPHHVPAESELVTSLLAAYEEETGKKGEAISTGGGTYAKVLKQGVAFGASFPGEEDVAHQAGEYASIDNLMMSMKIYANAILRLAAE